MKKKFLTSFIISLIIFAGLYAWLWMKIGSSRSVAQSMEKNKNISEVDNIEEGNKVEQIHLDEVLFLLVGVDTSDVGDIKVAKDGGTGIRSDTMILCKVNFTDGSIKMMSLPRDSKVPVKGKLDKLNHSHSYGGMKLLLQTIRDYTKLDVDYYVRVDYHSVKAIVDAIGGVKVNVQKDMYKIDTTKGKEYEINIKKGEQVLNGEQAMGFLRYRDYREGDVDRVKMQQYFLTEFIKQLIKPENILKLPQLFNAYIKYVDTNIDSKIIYQGIKLAGNIDGDKIETLILPGYGAKEESTGISYFFVNEKKAKAMIEENFSDYLMEK